MQTEFQVFAEGEIHLAPLLPLSTVGGWLAGGQNWAISSFFPFSREQERGGLIPHGFSSHCWSHLFQVITVFQSKNTPICFLLWLASGVESPEVCWKRLIPRKRVWLRDAGVGGRTGKPMGGATTGPAATLWGSGLRLWLTKARGSDRDTRGEMKASLVSAQPRYCTSNLSVCAQADHPPTSMSLERLRLHWTVFQGLCQWKVWKGKQVLESRVVLQIQNWQFIRPDNSSTNMYWKLNTRFPPTIKHDHAQRHAPVTACLLRTYELGCFLTLGPGAQSSCSRKAFACFCCKNWHHPVSGGRDVCQ